MKVIRLIKGGTYTAYGKTVRNGKTETFNNEQADYLVGTGHFELVEEIKKGSKPEKDENKVKE